jgi:hypothetical protein
MDEESSFLRGMHLHLSGFASAPFCIDGYTILICLGGGTVGIGKGSWDACHDCNGTHGSLGHDHVNML